MEITWEQKVEMCQLGNKIDDSDADKKAFEDFVLKHIDSFDGQAWDMFCNIVSIIPSEMELDIIFWEKVYAKFKDVDCNDEKFGLRTGMRVAMIQTVCEEMFSKEKKE